MTIKNLADVYSSQSVLVAQTPTSEIYRVQCGSTERILKVLSPVGMVDEAAGRHYLERIKSPYLVRIYEADESSQLIEYLPGDNLYSFCEQGDYLGADKILLRIIQSLHSKAFDIDVTSFPSLSDLFSVFNRVTPPEEFAETIRRAAELASKLLSTTIQSIPLHGDLHHENVRLCEPGLYKAFDPKGLIGDPTYELAIILKNPWHYPSISEDENIFHERAAFFANKLGYDLERVKSFAFVHFCMSLLWAIEDGVDYSHQSRLLKMNTSCLTTS